MLVTYVLGDCPKCGGKGRFGNVSVQGHHVLCGCMSCNYCTKVQLPEIRKKILYLDQFFFSHAFREGDPRFTKAVERIRHLSALQLLAVPFSSIHEDETHQWRGYDDKNKNDLMEFIKTTARGHEFEPAYTIEETQVVRSFQAFLQGEKISFDLQKSDAIRGNIHEWDDYFRIDVGRYIGDIELIRDLKRQSVEGLVDLFPEWRTSTNTFEQDIALELRDGAKGYIHSYTRYAARIACGDYTAVVDSPIMASVVESMLDCFPEETPYKEKLRKVGEFFNSNQFFEIPYQWISVRIFTVLKDMVKRGAYTDRETALKSLSGFFHDVSHVSTYAPYCDAFIMDKAMAALVSHSCIGLETRYGVKVFSLNNWDEFLAWMDELQNSMMPEHRAGLEAAYPYISYDLR